MKLFSSKKNRRRCPKLFSFITFGHKRVEKKPEEEKKNTKRKIGKRISISFDPKGYIPKVRGRRPKL
jgi:hypothetical protein